VSQKRINSDGTYYHEDCFNTLMEAIDESKKQIKAKMLKAQGMPPEQKAVDLTKTVRVAKSEIQNLPMPLPPTTAISQEDTNAGDNQENITTNARDKQENITMTDAGEIRGCCAACQKPVTTAMPRTAVEGVYYHQECYDSMLRALDKVKVQGRARYSAAVSHRVFETIMESPSPHKTPGGSQRRWTEDDEWSPMPAGESTSLQECFNAIPSCESSLMNSKGLCGVCQEHVYDTQRRCRSDDGVYMHAECFADFSKQP
jgi:hypothetical protein